MSDGARLQMLLAKAEVNMWRQEGAAKDVFPSPITAENVVQKLFKQTRITLPSACLQNPAVKQPASKGDDDAAATAPSGPFLTEYGTHTLHVNPELLGISIDDLDQPGGLRFKVNVAKR